MIVVRASTAVSAGCLPRRQLLIFRPQGAQVLAYLAAAVGIVLIRPALGGGSGLLDV
jgi:hypothetical protein